MKKALAILLAAMFCLSAVACSNNGSASSSAASTAASDTASAADSTDADPYAEHEEISIALWGIGNIISTEEDALRDYVFKKFNVTLTAQPVTWSDADEKIKLWSTSKNLPDLTAYAASFTTTFKDWTQGGVVRALPDSATDSSKYPDLAKLLASDWAKSANEISDTQTKYYAIPRPNFNEDIQNACSRIGIILRRDWLKQAGKEVPTDIDSLIDACKAMMAQHPGSVGLTSFNLGWLTGLMNGSCPAAVNGFQWVYADADDATYAGKIVPVWMTKSFVAGMKDMKKCLDADVIDPDYLLIKDEEGRDKFINDKACAYVHSGVYPGGVTILEDSMCTGDQATHKGSQLNELIVGMPLMKNAEGKVEYVLGDRCWSESYIAGNVDDVKAERICALMDWLLSEDGFKTVVYGIPGTDWTEDADGNVTFTLGNKPDGTPYNSTGEKYSFTSILSLACWSEFRSYMNKAISDGVLAACNEYTETIKAENPVVKDMPNVRGLTLDDAATYDVLDYNETINKFLTTSEDLDTYWAKFKTEQLGNGYDQVIDEMNSLYEARK